MSIFGYDFPRTPSGQRQYAQVESMDALLWPVDSFCTSL
jgi:hypothetical protein